SALPVRATKARRDSKPNSRRLALRTSRACATRFKSDSLICGSILLISLYQCLEIIKKVPTEKDRSTAYPSASFSWRFQNLLQRPGAHRHGEEKRPGCRRGCRLGKTRSHRAVWVGAGGRIRCRSSPVPGQACACEARSGY